MGVAPPSMGLQPQPSTGSSRNAPRTHCLASPTGASPSATYLPHAGTYPTRVPTLSRKLPNVGQTESSHQQMMPSSHLVLQVSKKPTPSCPNLRRVETRESSSCLPQHPRRSPQTPPQPFQPPRGNRTIRVMICLGRAWLTPQRCCASLVHGCAELADRSLFSDVVRGSFSFPLKIR